MAHYHKTKAFDSATDLIRALTAGLAYDREFLEPDDPPLFRGLGNADYSLVPAALRPDRNEELWAIARIADLVVPQGERGLALNQHRAELAVIRRFHRLANSVGLPLPAIPSETHQVLLATDHEAPLVADGTPIQDMHRAWPPSELWPLLGVAQHYGLPTRLLDWSYDSFTAAYFAALNGLERLENGEPGDSRLAIWQTSVRLIQRFSLAGNEPGNRPLHLIQPQAAGNPNLQAQRGAFTLFLQHLPDDGAPQVDRRPLDEQFQHLVEQPPEPVAMFKLLFHDIDSSKCFVKATLPISRSPNLLLALSELGYNAAALFPGFGGAAEAVRELRRINKFLPTRKQASETEGGASPAA